MSLDGMNDLLTVLFQFCELLPRPDWLIRDSEMIYFFNGAEDDLDLLKGFKYHGKC
jgi:hypothetical protein